MPTKILRSRAQSKEFIIQDLATDDNLSVAGTGQFLRKERYFQPMLQKLHEMPKRILMCLANYATCLAAL